MLSESEMKRVAYEVDTLGFSIVEDVVSPEFVKKMKQSLVVAVDEDIKKWGHKTQKKADLIPNMIEYGGEFVELMNNELMHSVFAKFLGESCILYNFSSTFLVPGDKQAPIQMHVDSPRVIPGYHDGIIMTLALDDFTDENGATVYLPGSQNLETVPERETFEKYCLSTARKAGAGLFFNPRCFHRASPNWTQSIRYGATIFAVRAFMKQRFDFPRMIPVDIIPTLGTRARQFLGFDARVPTSLDEFYVDEKDRLYKPNQG